MNDLKFANCILAVILLCGLGTVMLLSAALFGPSLFLAMGFGQYSIVLLCVALIGVATAPFVAARNVLAYAETL